MKDVFGLIVMSLPSILCVAMAGYLAMHGLDGWGWFLFAAILVSVTKAKLD